MKFEMIGFIIYCNKYLLRIILKGGGGMNRYIFLFDVFLYWEFVFICFFFVFFKEMYYKEKFNNFDKLFVIN